MRTQQLALAAVLTAAVFSATAAQTRMEPINSPFTWEALGATPTITFGRAASPKSIEAPKSVEAQKAAEAPKGVEAPRAAQPSNIADAPKAAVRGKAPAQAAGATATSPFTWDALGATPHVEVKKQPAKSEVAAPGAAAQ